MFGKGEIMVKEFEDLLLSTKREGIDKLLEFIRKSDFYKALRVQDSTLVMKVAC